MNGACIDKVPSANERRGVRLVPGGLEVGGAFVPLVAGSVHYWRLDPGDWRACLEATRALGTRLVDVYIPWSVHETAPGRLELGQSDPQRDVAAFLRLAHELGLYVIARPGPHINAELTCFGVPERIVWDPACQARTPGGNPVMLPMLPFAFPVPSYASDAFHDETARYFQLLAPALAPLLYPAGPIVMLQIDNEGAFYFRDGAYDQDYHPDAIRLYRAFLRDKYRTIDALQAAYGKRPEAKSEPAPANDPAPPAEMEASDPRDPAADAPPASPREPKRKSIPPRRPSTPPPPASEAEIPAEERFASLLPPTRFDAETAGDLARHLDWAEFHEHLLATAFERFARALGAAGLDGLPTSHNLPPGVEATPLNVAKVGRAVDLIGPDFYCRAGAQSRTTISRRVSELAVRCDALGIPAFSCEMGAGFPPFFPPLEERDSAFTVLGALAYGLRGFNIYMAVERDRWIGAPIDPRGRARPFAAFWRKLAAALDRTGFFQLSRRAPVRLVTPRSERRLARVMHAFGPVTGAFFSVAGSGARDAVAEDDLGLGYAAGIEADAFVHTLEQALEARGVPFAHVGGEDRDVSLGGAKWILCATSGGLNPALFRCLASARAEGARVTLGPREPVFDGAFRQLAEPFDLAALKDSADDLPALLADDPAAADAAVAHAIDALALPTYACDPDGVFATVHEDAAGRPRVLFVIHPGDDDVVARVAAPPGVGRATDVLDESSYEARRGALELRMKPRSVRMLALG